MPSEDTSQRPLLDHFRMGPSFLYLRISYDRIIYMKQKQSGFIQIIVVAFAFVLVVLIIGKTPIEMWNQYVEPVVVWSLLILSKFVEFLIRIFTQLLS